LTLKKLFTIAILAGLFFSTASAQVERKVIVEHFTNTRCGICASKNPGLYSTLNDYPDVIHLAYHPSSPYASCIFSQHNPTENDERTEYYGIFGGTPRVVMQGQVIASQTPLLKTGQIEGALGQQSDYSISVEQTKGAGTHVEVKIVIKRVSGLLIDDLSIRAVLAENEVDYNAPNGETKHNDVFRKQLLEESTTLSDINDSLVIIRNYTNNSAWDMDQIIVITTLENFTTKEILQADESGFASEGSSGIFNPIAREDKSVFYPNPASRELRFLPEVAIHYKTAEFFDLTGAKMMEVSFSGPIDISNFPPGLFFVILNGINGEKITTRVMKAGH